jgi:hypothetical protein
MKDVNDSLDLLVQYGGDGQPRGKPEDYVTSTSPPTDPRCALTSTLPWPMKN